MKLLGLSLSFVLSLWPVSAHGAAPQGDVAFIKIANSAFDSYIENPTIAEQQWMQAHYDKMQGWAPYFTSRLAWFPDTWFYRDAYAIFPGSQVFADHPDWVLRDTDANLLHIPWGCSGGTCPQYAGDFGNPDFRAWWIGRAQETMADGYLGIWIDDVNMDWRVSDGNGDFVNPVDPRTGQLMLYADWRRYMAEFVEEIRLALPTAEIAHNIIWFAADQVANDNPYVIRGIDAADYLNLERGIADSNLTGDGGDFGVTTFLSYVDFVQGRGKNVIFMDEASDPVERDYALAGWLLISGGSDLMTSENASWTTPDSWWHGYDLNLGEALGPRYDWQNLIRRDFECGLVAINPPGRPDVSVQLPQTFTTIDGAAVNAATLSAKESLILLSDCAVTTIDADDDGVFDIFDNCLVTANASQSDSNSDGYGNICDPDLNNDCIVNVIDLGILKSRFFTSDADADLNGDGIVNVIELGILKARFFTPPGPSGTAGAACASD